MDMKRTPKKQEVIALTMNKIIGCIPECKTEDELRAFLRKDALRPRGDRIADGQKLLEESKRQLEQSKLLY